MKHFLIILLLAVLPVPALQAYGPIGHRVIASIARNELSTGARKKIEKVIGTNGMIYFSTWADEVRSDSSYSYSYPWHYQNLNTSITPETISTLWDNPASEGEHLFYAIQQLTHRLKKDKKDVEALKFLIHFTGDLYQPMHLGRQADLGGNKVAYTWFGEKSNIHRLWDSQLIDHYDMSYSELARYLTDKFTPQKRKLKKTALTGDLYQSYQLCVRIYNYDNRDMNNYLYFYRFSPEQELQLYKAGLRLAQFLESIY